MYQPSPAHPDSCARPSGSAWIALALTAGVAASAFLLLRKLRTGHIAAGVEDILTLCDRAAEALDQRLTGDIALAG
jgi:hypothetical protein